MTKPVIDATADTTADDLRERTEDLECDIADFLIDAGGRIDTLIEATDALCAELEGARQELPDDADEGASIEALRTLERARAWLEDAAEAIANAQEECASLLL